MKIKIVKSGKGKTMPEMRGDIGIKKHVEAARPYYSIYFTKKSAKVYDIKVGDELAFGVADIYDDAVGFVNLTKDPINGVRGPLVKTLINGLYFVRFQGQEAVDFLDQFVDGDTYREYKLFNKKGNYFIRKSGVYDESKVKTTEFFPSDFGQ